MNIRSLFSEQDQKLIREAIAGTEKVCSGEIRVHIEHTCKGDVLDRAADVFRALKMHETELRNGILIYLAPADHKTAVIGDKGINEKVPEGFWDNVLEKMKEAFAQAKYTEGLTEAIRMTGEQLRIYFPYDRNDRNELSNDISFSEQE